ncbi:MAG: hypothetical protein QOE51_563, partial [Actinoplanes sp.]|nr:hypothetical protein [Actinoplanes sp.]
MLNSYEYQMRENSMNRKMKRLGLAFAVLTLAGGGTVYGAVNANADTQAAASTPPDRRIEVAQYGMYVANLCIKNVTQNQVLSCTGKVGYGSVRELFVPFNQGDSVEFIVAVVLGHNVYHQI